MANASTYKDPVGPLRHRCPQCTAVGSEILRCSGCNAIRYFRAPGRPPAQAQVSLHQD